MLTGIHFLLTYTSLFECDHCFLHCGPAALVREHGTQHEKKYVDECHLCYQSRMQLFERFPECLGPPQVFGADDK